MSLNWNFQKVEDFKKKEQDPEIKTWLNVLIWTSLAIQLGSITEKNVSEWQFRIAYLNATKHFIGHQTEGEGKKEKSFGVNVPLDLIPKLIGFSTNVSTKGRSGFYSFTNHKHIRNAESEFRRFKQRQNSGGCNNG